MAKADSAFSCRYGQVEPALSALTAWPDVDLTVQVGVVARSAQLALH